MPLPSPPPDAIRSFIIFFLGGRVTLNESTRRQADKLQDLAVCADLVLQGIIFAQIGHYTTLYAKDALRGFVAVLLVLTTLKSAQQIAILWIQNVENFANLGAGANMFSSSGLWTELNPALVALISFYIQLFFCAKLYVISRNVYIVALVITLFVFALVAAIISSAFAFAVEIHLGTVFVGDVLLSGCTIYFLLHHSKHAAPDTAGMLNSLTKLTFQSAAPAVVCALISLVGSLAWKGPTPNAYIMLAIIANNALPKLYAISAMWTLNSRRRIRQAHSNFEQRASVATSGCRRQNGIEPTEPWVSTDWSAEIHVQREVQTTRYTKPLFSPQYDRPYH
ncbi:hypothetical protein B0H19DRAFT_1070210 [Mycena capillaripes]|nr:hypothetical protein B0H19DRAFT_1070210 [Mycena capillaripes]